MNEVKWLENSPNSWSEDCNDNKAFLESLCVIDVCVFERSLNGKPGEKAHLKCKCNRMLTFHSYFSLVLAKA